MPNGLAVGPGSDAGMAREGAMEAHRVGDADRARDFLDAQTRLAQQAHGGLDAQLGEVARRRRAGQPAQPAAQRGEAQPMLPRQSPPVHAAGVALVERLQGGEQLRRIRRRGRRRRRGAVDEQARGGEHGAIIASAAPPAAGEGEERPQLGVRAGGIGEPVHARLRRQPAARTPARQPSPGQIDEVFLPPAVHLRAIAVVHARAQEPHAAWAHRLRIGPVGAEGP